MPYGAILGQKPKEATEATIEYGVVNTGESVTAGQVVDFVTTNVPISQVAVGTVVKINENGSPVNYIVVNQGIPGNSPLYDSSCNGTWVLRQDIYANAQWNSSNVNNYGTSTLNTTYLPGLLSLYDSWLQTSIKQVKIPYVNGTGSGGSVSSGSNGLSTKLFLLSGYEVGFSTSDNQGFPVDGAKLSYFDAGNGTIAKGKRIAELNGSAASWWLRSPYTYGTTVTFTISFNGAYINVTNSSGSYGVRPCFILPSAIHVQPDGTLAPTSTSLSYFITTEGTPSTAIALESGNAGDTIPVIFTGTTSAPFITRDQTIQGADGGVFGYGILDGILGVTAKQEKESQGNVRIETGSYTGTGTYGQSNPNTLTFSFEPKVVFIQGVRSSPTDDTVNKAIIICPSGIFETDCHEIGSTAGAQTTDAATCNLTVNGNTISWYLRKILQSINRAYAQLNSSGTTYHYVAIG